MTDLTKPSTREDIPTTFSLAQLVEEVTVTLRERMDFLEKKLQSGKLGDPERNMMQFRIKRMAAVVIVMTPRNGFNGHPLDPPPAWVIEAQGREEAERQAAVSFVAASSKAETKAAPAPEPPAAAPAPQPELKEEVVDYDDFGD